MIAGILLRKRKSYDLLSFKNSILNTLNQFSVADRTGFYQNDKTILVQTTMFNTPESFFDPTPYVDEISKNVILSWGILVNREELAKELNISDETLKETCDSELILKSFLRWGESCTSHIYGDFSFVIYNLQSISVFCVIDHMGVKPFYYYLCDDYFIFASTVSVFHILKLVPMKPDMEWAAKYILHLSMDFEKTPYKDIFKLKPANQMTVSQDTHSIKEYFKFKAYDDDSLGRVENYLEIYREHLKKAVSSRIRTKYNIGSESSGGLDSSTVTALAVKLFDQPIEKFYTFGFARLEYEPQYILKLSQHYGISNSFISCRENFFTENIKLRSLKVIGYPAEHNTAIGHSDFYKIASVFNVRTLLSGFGGDEFVSSLNGNLVLVEYLTARKYLELLSNMRGSLLFRMLRMIKFIYKNKYARYRDYNSYLFNAYNKRWPYCVIKDDIIDLYQLKTQYFNKAKLDAGYTNFKEFIIKNRFASFIPTRTAECTLMANSYRIDYRWPLIDTRLIQLFLSMPSKVNYQKGIGRYIHRHAVENIVPHMINWKQGKYMGEPVRKRTSEKINNNLHPDLFKLIDMTKLDRIINTSNITDKDISFALRKSATAINFLDLWLKNFHANGSLWNT